MADNEDFLPPPRPLPVLSIEQLKHLCRLGWLSYDLPMHISERLTRLFSRASDFFDLDTEEKQRLYPSSRGTECGFYRVEGEKEYVTLRRQVHNDVAFEQEASHAWTEIAQLLHGMLVDLSRAEGLDTGVWNSMLDGSLCYPPSGTDLNDVVTLVRLFRYYPTSGVAEPHTDLGILTLCIGEGAGLEVMDGSQESVQWQPAAKVTINVAPSISPTSSKSKRPYQDIRNRRPMLPDNNLPNVGPAPSTPC